MSDTLMEKMLGLPEFDVTDSTTLTLPIPMPLSRV